MEEEVVFAGRSAHLASLASVFWHRHGTWRDFGNFLKELFRDFDGPSADGGEIPRLDLVVCRHNPGGEHFPALEASRSSPGQYPMFDPLIHSRPCVTVGTFENNKNPGLVVSDLCIKAKEFLFRIGKGGPLDDPLGRDTEYVPPSGSPTPDRIPPSQATDSYGDIVRENILGQALRGSREESQRSVGSSTHYDGDSIWGEDGTEQQSIDHPSHEESQMTIALSDIGSIDSPGVGGSRRSTKMRVATLAYLWKFADHPAKLQEEFDRLRTDRNLQVLHLCGCGLCRTENGVRLGGCVEKTHLILGTAVLNGHHRTFHQTFGLCRISDYASLCEIFHRAEAGGGVF